MLSLRLVRLTERVRFQTFTDLRARNRVLSGSESDLEPDYDYDSEPLRYHQFFAAIVDRHRVIQGVRVFSPTHARMPITDLMFTETI